MFTLVVSISPSVTEAHEVYVLNHDEIDNAMRTVSPNLFQVILDHQTQFIISGLVALAIVIGVFFLSITLPIEKKLNPALHKIKHWAPSIAQFTLGLALVTGGYFDAAFGIELPLVGTFGSFDTLARSIYIILGACIIFGIFPRIAGTLAFISFLPFVFQHGTYMLNYGTYFGEAFTLSLLGGGYALFGTKIPAFEQRIERHWHKYKFLILRIVFGISLIYASMYAKLFHGALALETVTKYHLTDYLPFDGSFIVLGAFITELLIGIFFVIGFEIRFTSLLFLAFLTQSLFFFGEAVWPHIILIGTALAMFTHGYDKYTLEAKLTKRKDLEPVL